MFENPGSKIKSIAVLCFGFGVVLSLILAILFGRTISYSGNSKFNFWYFLLILVSGVLGSFVSSLFIYAIGEITENTKRAANAAEESARICKKLLNGSTQSDDGYNGHHEAQSRVSNSNASLTAASIRASGTWVCKKCGTKNNAPAIYCKDCGAYK